MKQIMIRPGADPGVEIDVTHTIIGAIAQELWTRYGGNDKLNWIEAECHLMQFINTLRAEAQVGERTPAGTVQRSDLTPAPAVQPVPVVSDPLGRRRHRHGRNERRSKGRTGSGGRLPAELLG